MGVSSSASLTSLTSLRALHTWSFLNLDSKTTQKWLLWSFKNPDKNVFKSMQQQKAKKILYIISFKTLLILKLLYRLVSSLCLKFFIKTISKDSTLNQLESSHFSDFITFYLPPQRKKKKSNTLSSVSFVLDHRDRNTFVLRVFFVVIVHLCACQSWGARTGKVQARLKR